MCIRFLLTEPSSIGSVAKAAADATQDVERLRQRMDSEYQSAVAPAKVLTTLLKTFEKSLTSCGSCRGKGLATVAFVRVGSRVRAGPL